MKSAGNFTLATQEAGINFFIVFVWGTTRRKVDLHDPCTQIPER